MKGVKIVNKDSLEGRKVTRITLNIFGDNITCCEEELEVCYDNSHVCLLRKIGGDLFSDTYKVSNTDFDKIKNKHRKGEINTLDIILELYTVFSLEVFVLEKTRESTIKELKSIAHGYINNKIEDIISKLVSAKEISNKLKDISLLDEVIEDEYSNAKQITKKFVYNLQFK